MLGNSSCIPPTKHDVFLSFRGEDTRNGFADHLYAVLCSKKIKTFIDDRLCRGNEISLSIQEAIEESNIYVIIFSQHYVSSTWCLEELTKILECKSRYGRAVIPVFYKVDPSLVRDQRGSYGDAFAKHELLFKDKIMGWKVALTQAAGLSGWGSKIVGLKTNAFVSLLCTRPEYLLVQEIVQDVLRILKNRSPILDYQGLVGIYKHMAEIQSLLHVESEAVRIIGMWGIGGIGKTTIARAIYHNLANQFTSCSFVVNVHEEVERYGMHHTQSKYLSELVGEENTSSGLSFSDERLKREKVLLILDNINNSYEIGDLIGGRGCFGPGSRIIVTSRDMQVLKNAEVDELYEVKEMSFQDSLQLFSLNAFKQNYPIENYMNLSEKVLNYAKGIPLGLKVLGLLLYGRTKEEWESVLEKLEKLHDLDTFDVLKLSYDELDNEQKDIFLNIACFYRGHDMNTVKQALDSCGFSSVTGMSDLIDRGFISILKGEIVMHDLIQEMGQEIVRQQCASEPGKRSRLWKNEDIYHVLRENKGTDAVKYIFLDTCQIKEVQLHSGTFKMMLNLRLLQFCNSKSTKDSKVHVPEFLVSLPDDLRFLCWDGFSQRSLPLDFCPANLVKLDMRYSKLEQLWERDQNLIKIPDLSQSPNIEEIILSHCVSLVQVYSSSFLSKLNCLWLNGCDGLRSLNLPSNILSQSSGLIVLYDCCNLEMFSIGYITMGTFLYSCPRSRSIESIFRNSLPGQTICCSIDTKTRSLFEKFSDTFDPIDSGADFYEEPEDNIHLLNLKMLREGSPSLFPSLNELCWLDLSYCESLTRTAIQELPSSLHNLVALEELSLRRCQRLVFIPPSIGSVSKLCMLDLAYCESLETLPSSIFKLKLTKLDLNGCSMLRTFPEILDPAESFALISLTKTAIKELPSSLEKLVGLQTLQLNLCKDLELLPNSISKATLLSKLDLSGCDKLSEIPSNIGHLSSLRELSLRESGIVNLPESIVHLSSLKSLDLSDCKKLECIPQLPPFLKYMAVFDCPSIRRVSSSHLNFSSDSKEGIFKFHLTNSQELDPSAQSNLAADAWLRILQDAYKSVFYCFPGSAVPHWFPYRCKGHSVTMKIDSLSWCSDDKFIGFALCVVLGLEGINDEECKYSVFSYRFTFESDDGIHIIPSHDQLRYYFNWKGQQRFVVNDHTFMWKYYLDSSSISQLLSRAHNFTFEICKYDVGHFWLNNRPTFKLPNTITYVFCILQ
ncbi:disease resistance-like protein DSC1 [Abrus precatorius]|uniref:ADP-ribosyl cyclase/cyclic ADP-ribose hydrolase n=1 Tax=Abrus precatorius TaxID=3816 RepID=A0A8B8KHE9_ABRPR|nr:disease resistance-like protein DSC1 [Abrus precatorius]